MWSHRELRHGEAEHGTVAHRTGPGEHGPQHRALLHTLCHHFRGEEDAQSNLHLHKRGIWLKTTFSSIVRRKKIFTGAGGHGNVRPRSIAVDSYPSVNAQLSVGELLLPLIVLTVFKEPEGAIRQYFV